MASAKMPNKCTTLYILIIKTELPLQTHNCAGQTIFGKKKPKKKTSTLDKWTIPNQLKSLDINYYLGDSHFSHIGKLNILAI